ncbi:DUF4262 domain-containing protein [Amycolatopsis rhabdoformis]|uniref:DUF4262 domain-containing protein n=1 Tax=Amycolatopsis rhabdoformis TaxID=1448059 RepID=A0ABZ1HUF4_9PSEU|nr:DUF4262 domain-containing protein [Amycolatopsis rhabdoformis]WSE26010.1 DUF4262 domain-containing protein [Amycolatopsis rhabdoformis]
MPLDDATTCKCVVCRDYGDRARLDAVDAGLVEHVADPGWGLLAIPEDHVSAGWTFTVGLWHSFRSPELAVFGLDPDSGMDLLNAIGDQVAAGLRLEAGSPVTVAGAAKLTLRPVDMGWHRAFFGTARGFYRATEPAVPFLQVLWPDPAGRFPTEDGFAAEYEPFQPRLWLEPTEHPRGPWTADL